MSTPTMPGGFPAAVSLEELVAELIVGDRVIELSRDTKYFLGTEQHFETGENEQFITVTEEPETRVSRLQAQIHFDSENGWTLSHLGTYPTVIAAFTQTKPGIKYQKDLDVFDLSHLVGSITHLGKEGSFSIVVDETPYKEVLEKPEIGLGSDCSIYLAASLDYHRGEVIALVQKEGAAKIEFRLKQIEEVDDSTPTNKLPAVSQVEPKFVLEYYPHESGEKTFYNEFDLSNKLNAVITIGKSKGTNLPIPSEAIDPLQCLISYRKDGMKLEQLSRSIPTGLEHKGGGKRTMYKRDEGELLMEGDKICFPNGYLLVRSKK